MTKNYKIKIDNIMFKMSKSKKYDKHEFICKFTNNFYVKIEKYYNKKIANIIIYYISNDIMVNNKMFIIFIETAIKYIKLKYEIENIYIIDKSIVVYNDNSYIPLIELYYMINEKIWFDESYDVDILYKNFLNNKIDYNEIKEYLLKIQYNVKDNSEIKNKIKNVCYTGKELLLFLESNLEYYNFIKIYKKYTNFILYYNEYLYINSNIKCNDIVIKKYNKNINYPIKRYEYYENLKINEYIYFYL